MAVQFITIKDSLAMVINRPFGVCDIVISTSLGLNSVRIVGDEELDQLIKGLELDLKKKEELQKAYEEIKAKRKAVGRPRKENLNETNS